MKVLAIDYGDRKIGLAISDENQKLASRLLTLENKSQDESISRIIDIIEENNIIQLLVGMPEGLKTQSEQGRKTDDFIKLLEAKTEIPIKTINEVYTSKMAEENLLQSGVKRENFREIIDQEAARIILQDYLNILKE